jgi:peptide/nickel transport system permease protein
MSAVRFDAVIMRLNDVILAIPQLVFALLAITVLGPQGWVLVTVIGLTHAPAHRPRGEVGDPGRHHRGLHQGRGDVRDAAVEGAPPRAAAQHHRAVERGGGLRLTYSIGYIASLSFLGLGLQPPAADWGLMINENRIALSIQPWGVLLPVIAIALLTIGTNLLADSFARATASTSVEA